VICGLSELETIISGLEIHPNLKHVLFSFFGKTKPKKHLFASESHYLYFRNYIHKKRNRYKKILVTKSYILLFFSPRGGWGDLYSYVVGLDENNKIWVRRVWAIAEDRGHLIYIDREEKTKIFADFENGDKYIKQEYLGYEYDLPEISTVDLLVEARRVMRVQGDIIVIASADRTRRVSPTSIVA